MNDDALLIARLEDKAAQAADRYMITTGDFLDSHQRRIAEETLRSRSMPVPVCFYGGFEDAERCMPVFLPDYAGEEDLKELVRVIRVSCAAGGRRLTHRDYLGSLLSLGPIDRLHVVQGKAEVQRDTVASLRLDSVTASAFRMSRAKAAEAIRRGLVSVNSMEALKTDQLLREGDKIVLRGKGRVILSEIGGSSRKERIRVTYQVYK